MIDTFILNIFITVKKTSIRTGQGKIEIYIEMYWILAEMPQEDSKCTIGGSLCISGDILWECVGTLPQNSYGPSQNVWKATLQRRTISVQWFARIFSKQTHRQTNIILLLYKEKQINYYFYALL